MDWQQASQTIAWLDKEHRQDRVKLGELEARLETLMAETGEVSRQAQGQEGRLQELIEEVARFDQFKGLVEEVKGELIALINQAREQTRHSEETINRTRKDDWDAYSRSLAELGARLDPLPRLEERVASLRVENGRAFSQLQELQGRMPELSQRIDGQAARLPYLEERARQDSKRLGELEQWVEESVKRLQAQLPKLAVLDERVARNQMALERMANLGEDLKAESRSFAEEMRLAERERVLGMGRWREEMEAYASQIANFSERHLEFEEHFAKARQMLGEISGLREQVLQGAEALVERQRVAEEALHIEFERWREEAAGLWVKHGLEWGNHLDEERAFRQMVSEQFAQMVEWRREELRLAEELKVLIQEEQREREICQGWLEGIWGLEEERAQRDISGLEEWLEEARRRTELWRKARRD